MNIFAKCNKIFTNQIQKGIKHIFYGKILHDKKMDQNMQFIKFNNHRMGPRVEITI